MLKLLRNEAQMPAVWLTAALFLAFGSGWFAAAASNAGLTLVLFAWLFARHSVGRVRRGAACRASRRDSSASPTAR